MPSPEEKQRRRALLRELRSKQQAAVEEYLERMRQQKRFYVFRRDATTCEVQVINEDGATRADAEYTDASTPLDVGGEIVPVEVLLAGFRRTTGDGDYVNEKGETIALW